MLRKKSAASLVPCLGESFPESRVGHKDTFPIETQGGIFHVRWDTDTRVSAVGGVVPLAQFLEATKLFDGWVSDCPLHFTSNRAHDKRDILGTFLLSALHGHSRYAHITGIRHDGVSSGVLGMERVVSEDSVRRALKRMDGEAARRWSQRHLLETLRPLLSEPWILDVDVTIKPIYGGQEGANIGYNPHKPGRPSHAYHSFLLAKARLVLDVEVHPGDEHSSATTRTDLFHWLEKIPRAFWPKLLRGDCGFGTEHMMAWPELVGLPYLFKQRMTKNTKAAVRLVDVNATWHDAGQGWQGTESHLLLSGWSQKRRIIILRRPYQPRYPRNEDKKKITGSQQLCIDEVASLLLTDQRDFEYHVLVTNLPDTIPIIAQCYRERGDAENIFDELKNHWGWTGFTTKKIIPCQIAARMTAQIYNWWSLFVRLASPHHHREAVTSRPILLNTIARQTTTGGQRFLTITSNHTQKTHIAQYFTALTKYLSQFIANANAEQWNATKRWEYLLRKIFSSCFSTITPKTG